MPDQQKEVCCVGGFSRPAHPVFQWAMRMMRGDLGESILKRFPGLAAGSAIVLAMVAGGAGPRRSPVEIRTIEAVRETVPVASRGIQPTIQRSGATRPDPAKSLIVATDKSWG